MWLPEGWWIITEKSTDGTRFTAGAKGLPEIESSAKFRSDRDATGVARKALRSMAYENQDSGWSKFRCHARLPGQLKAFCGARIENGLSFSLKDGRKTYKVVYRNSMKVFEFFKESEI